MMERKYLRQDPNNNFDIGLYPHNQLHSKNSDMYYKEQYSEELKVSVPQILFWINCGIFSNS